MARNYKKWKSKTANPIQRTAVNAYLNQVECNGVSTGGNTPPFEDLGGPTPENYSPTNDSAKAERHLVVTLKQVKDVVNKGAKPAEGMATMNEDEELQGNQLVAEQESPEAEEETMKKMMI